MSYHSVATTMDRDRLRDRVPLLERCRWSAVIRAPPMESYQQSAINKMLPTECCWRNAIAEKPTEGGHLCQYIKAAESVVDCHTEQTDLVPLISLSVHSVTATVAVMVICRVEGDSGALNPVAMCILSQASLAPVNVAPQSQCPPQYNLHQHLEGHHCNQEWRWPPNLEHSQPSASLWKQAPTAGHTQLLYRQWIYIHSQHVSERRK